MYSVGPNCTPGTMEEFAFLASTACSRMAEQRRIQRIPCSRPVKLLTSDDREVEALCTDLNSSGLGLDTRQILAVGQRVELLVGEQTRVPLLVIYRMGNHYGLSAITGGEKLLSLLPVQ